MSKLNFLVYLNASSDPGCPTTNNPLKNNFKWEQGFNGQPCSNPASIPVELAPNESRTILNGARTLTQDGTTEYSLALASGQTSIYQLSWASGTKPGFRASRTSGADATTSVTVTVNGPVVTFSAPSISAVAASFTGQVLGMTTNVTITADNVGTVGNAVALTGDGTSSINLLISNWNIANPSNTISLTSGDGTQIPLVTEVIHLSGGINAATPFNLISGGVVVGDYVNVGNLFNTLNQGQWAIISLTATSFSVANPGGVAEGPYVLGSSFASQIDIYSAAGVQVGDQLVISGGFSPVSWGTYLVTQVTDLYVQFSSTAVLPPESSIMTEAIAFYFIAKSLIYLEANQPCTVTINGSQMSQIIPLPQDCCDRPCKPGILLLTSAVHTLAVQNNSPTANASLLLLCVE